jgi:hypothetical protein
VSLRLQNHGAMPGAGRLLRRQGACIKQLRNQALVLGEPA